MLHQMKVERPPEVNWVRSTWNNELNVWIPERARPDDELIGDLDLAEEMEQNFLPAGLGSKEAVCLRSFRRWSRKRSGRIAEVWDKNAEILRLRDQWGRQWNLPKDTGLELKAPT